MADEEPFRPLITDHVYRMVPHFAGCGYLTSCRKPASEHLRRASPAVPPPMPVPRRGLPRGVPLRVQRELRGGR